MTYGGGGVRWEGMIPFLLHAPDDVGDDGEGDADDERGEWEGEGGEKEVSD